MAGKKQPAKSSTGLAWEEIERALGLMAQHGLEEFEYEDQRIRIRLKRPGSNFAAAHTPAAAPTAAAAPAVPPAEPPAATEEALHIIKSPIVGTFYAGPQPGAPPFVQVGDRVRPGQVLCIIEAMKLMNEIESDIAGEVVRIFVEDGQPVEYGEPLFALRPLAAS
jgi:acetyl-CoA carboxylase biotin carboxyl carrier protein